MTIKVFCLKYQRDPNLPPPEVCDWLLGQEWSEASRVDVQSGVGSVSISECHVGHAFIKEGEMMLLLLPAGTFDALCEDATDRMAMDWIDRHCPQADTEIRWHE